MSKIKVGVFVPYSGIYRNLKSDFLNGISTAIPDDLKKDIVFQPEFIQSGGIKQVEDAFRKLALFESVDLLTGIVGTSTLINLIPSINTERIPCIINNIGGYMPTEQLSSPYLFYNSLHLWKSEWVMGKWMQDKFGGIPAIGTHVYDTGYNLSESFRIGTVASGSDECRLHVLKSEGLAGFANTMPLVEIFKHEKPAHAHVILSGREGTEFINNFYSDTDASAIPLSVSPFTLSDSATYDFKRSTQIFNAISWDYSIDNEENIKFINKYEGDFFDRPNVFSLLGYENGLGIVAALNNISNVRVTKEKITEALNVINLNGPRGEIALSTDNLNTNMPIYIRSGVVDDSRNHLVNEIVDVANGIEWNDKTLTSVRQSHHSWQNPYLCV